MNRKSTVALRAGMHTLVAVVAVAAGARAVAASACSCTMEREKACIDAASAGRNVLCETKKCPAGARFSTEACPKKDLVATCSMKGPDYATHNRYYAPVWKLETVKGMCAGMKGEFSPAAR